MSDETPQEALPHRTPVREGLLFDYDGKPVTDLLEFGRLAASPDKVVAVTEVAPGGQYVSTVWIGSDPMHGVMRALDADASLPPLIYESALFDEQDGYVDRLAVYPTREAAARGHEEIVAERGVP